MQNLETLLNIIVQSSTSFCSYGQCLSTVFTTQFRADMCFSNKFVYSLIFSKCVRSHQIPQKTQWDCRNLFSPIVYCLWNWITLLSCATDEATEWVRDVTSAEYITKTWISRSVFSLKQWKDRPIKLFLSVSVESLKCMYGQSSLTFSIIGEMCFFFFFFSSYKMEKIFRNHQYCN